MAAPYVGSVMRMAGRLCSHICRRAVVRLGACGCFEGLTEFVRRGDEELRDYNNDERLRAWKSKGKCWSLLIMRLPLPQTARYALRAFLGLVVDPTSFLKPSLKSTAFTHCESDNPSANRKRRPVGLPELIPVVVQETKSSITSICFGQENANREYVLLAVASADGTAVVYFCYVWRQL